VGEDEGVRGASAGDGEGVRGASTGEGVRGERAGDGEGVRVTAAFTGVRDRRRVPAVRGEARGSVPEVCLCLPTGERRGEHGGGGVHAHHPALQHGDPHRPLHKSKTDQIAA